jgi:hypothetical protein
MLRTKMPWYQSILAGWSISLSAFAALGEIFESVGAAIAMITPIITYGGTGAVLLSLAGMQIVARWKRPTFVMGSTAVRVTRIGSHVWLHALGFLALLWIPRVIGAPSGPAPPEVEFPVYDSGLRDVKGAYFANGPVRMIDGIVLDGQAVQSYDNYNTTRDRVLRVRDGSSILISIFFYNSAIDPAATDTTIVGEARITAGLDTSQARTSHSISAGAVGMNTRAIYSTSPDRGGNISIVSSDPVKLKYVPGSTFMCVHRPPVFERQLPTASDPTGICRGARRRGPVQFLHLPDGIVNGAVLLGRIPGQISGFVVFRLNVSEEREPHVPHGKTTHPAKVRYPVD